MRRKEGQVYVRACTCINEFPSLREGVEGGGGGAKGEWEGVM